MDATQENPLNPGDETGRFPRTDEDIESLLTTGMAKENYSHEETTHEFEEEMSIDEPQALGDNSQDLLGYSPEDPLEIESDEESTFDLLVLDRGEKKDRKEANADLVDDKKNAGTQETGPNDDRISVKIEDTSSWTPRSPKRRSNPSVSSASGPNLSNSTPVIVLFDSDSEEAYSKEPEVIEINSDDDAGYFGTEYGSTVHVKKEADIGSDIGTQIIDLESTPDQAQPEILGNSFLGQRGTKRKRHDPETMKRIQEAYLRKLSSKNGVPAGASAVFRAPLPEKPGEKSFKETKREYLAKKKNHQNTFQDDVDFAKAKEIELAKIRKTERDLLVDEDDEAEESEDGLFVSQSNDSGMPPNYPNEAKRRKPVRRSREQHREMEEQLHHNMIAGLPPKYLEDLRAKVGYRGRDSETVIDHRITALINAADPNQKRKRKLSKINNLRSLAYNDIMEAAKVNATKDAIPVMTGTEKRTALAGLVARTLLEKEKMHQARSDSTGILEASRVIGLCKVQQDAKQGEGAWKRKGLRYPLHHYQVQGIAKMKLRENDTTPAGGILADEMGLGKTLQMIALAISNPAPPGAEHRSTLIICTPALIRMWETEIDKHTDDNILPKLIRHHGINRLAEEGKAAQNSVNAMEQADIVLSTYNEVRVSYPKWNAPEGVKDLEELRGYWRTKWDHERGILHRVHWHRIILDEAQAIKNYSSSTSIACRALMGKHRWALSGTPIMNRVEEFYPYFKFLQIAETGTFKLFRQNFCGKSDDIFNQRLHSFLDHLMIRRVHSDEVMGHKLVDLPEMRSETKRLDLNTVEELFYSLVRVRCANQINRAVTRMSEDDHRDMMLRMLLRLRQMTSHLMMLQEIMERHFDVVNINIIWYELSTKIKSDVSNAEDMMSAIKAMIAAKDQDEADSTTPEKAILEESEILAKNEPLEKRFRQALRELKKRKLWLDLKSRLSCQQCGVYPEDPYLTSCLHLYCKQCLTVLASEASRNNSDRTFCLACNAVFEKSSPFSVPDQLKKDFQSEVDSNLINSDRENKRPHRNYDDNIKWCTLDKSRVLSSTKSTAVAKQIQDWMAEKSGIKTVVFSQFHLFMKVMEKECEQRGWGYCTYNGKMTQKARQDTLKKFDEDPATCVMIASLQSGGIGLNLTMAQRVISVDLWYNECVERQAFCRIYRIGQTQKTFYTRLVVKNTVDEKLLIMQETKSKEIKQAMDERDVLKGLSKEELMSLFGEVRRDDHDNPFIYVQEYPIFDKLSEFIGERVDDSTS